MRRKPTNHNKHGHKADFKPPKPKTKPKHFYISAKETKLERQREAKLAVNKKGSIPARTPDNLSTNYYSLAGLNNKISHNPATKIKVNVKPKRYKLFSSK